MEPLEYRSFSDEKRRWYWTALIGGLLPSLAVPVVVMVTFQLWDDQFNSAGRSWQKACSNVFIPGGAMVIAGWTLSLIAVICQR